MLTQLSEHAAKFTGKIKMSERPNKYLNTGIITNLYSFTTQIIYMQNKRRHLLFLSCQVAQQWIRGHNRLSWAVMQVANFMWTKDT